MAVEQHVPHVFVPVCGQCIAVVWTSQGKSYVPNWYQVQIWGNSLVFPSSICYFKRKFIKNKIWIFLSSLTEGLEEAGKVSEKGRRDFLTEKLFPSASSCLTLWFKRFLEQSAILLCGFLFPSLAHNCLIWGNCKRSRAFQDRAEKERKRERENPSLLLFTSFHCQLEVADVVWWGY